MQDAGNPSAGVDPAGTVAHSQSSDQASGLNRKLMEWVDEIAQLTQPDIVHWCTGSDEEIAKLQDLMVRQGTLLPLDPKKYPGSFYARSDVNDVARVEDRTFICSASESDAGPSNNWSDPVYMREQMDGLFAGSMQGRVMYVMPYLMGPPGSDLSQVGVQITDSPYVVANMRIMTRIGTVALAEFDRHVRFVRGLHSTGTLDPEQRFICHFPEDQLIMSFSSNYGGNALLGKKCHALRLASATARQEGWMAEHMLILGITSPDGAKTYIAGAFPSACGKTNLAMLVPPDADLAAGWKVETIGDDIAWLRFGEDGRLYAINPEAGFFGVAPGTSMETNPNAMRTLGANTIFTNVAFCDDRTVWWEGMDGDVPNSCTDWTGKQWTPQSNTPAAHPNSRFTTPASQCPCISDDWENPEGVPISAIIFGGRRSTTVPLAYEAFNWQHGTYVGATLTSEKTAAASGATGQLRYDPMAMLPFCGYHMADYWQHWLDMGRQGGDNMPKIFHVNWFRKDWSGNFLWPGFRENMRVLKWVIDRVRGLGEATQTPIGMVPNAQSLELNGFGWSEEVVKELLAVDPNDWYKEVDQREEFLARFGTKLPHELLDENEALRKRLANAPPQNG
jgi:phosphoenolpyruvate carboxykinase (GTP)